MKTVTFQGRTDGRKSDVLYVGSRKLRVGVPTEVSDAEAARLAQTDTYKLKIDQDSEDD